MFVYCSISYRTFGSFLVIGAKRYFRSIWCDFRKAKAFLNQNGKIFPKRLYGCGLCRGIMHQHDHYLITVSTNLFKNIILNMLDQYVVEVLNDFYNIHFALIQFL